MKDKEKSKTMRYVFIAAGSILLAAAVAFTRFLRYFALSPSYHRKKKSNGKPNPLKEFMEPGSNWIRKEAQHVTLVNQQGMKLHGLYLPSIEAGQTRCVILCHGYRNSCVELGYHARHFWQKGYSVLLPDARGHGDSEGTYIGMGWQERKDILEWIDFLCKKNSKSQIVLMGISMGAATVMMTSGETLPHNVKAVIEDCGYTSVWEEFKNQMHNAFHLPAFPFLYISSIVSKVLYGFSFWEASALKQVAKSNCPTLFIHGSKDTFVPFFMLNKLYHAASCEKEKLVIDGAGHAENAMTDPKLYWNTIHKFLEQYIY